MIQSLSTAATGAKSLQTRIDTIANNVVNIDTEGFKASRVSFKEAVYQSMRSPIQPQEGKNLQLGHGALVADTALDFGQGPIRTTEQPLDFAIDGEGFFTVRTAQGAMRYTRGGAFGVSDEDTGSYLVTAQGYYVLDANGERIRLPENLEGMSCTQQGVLTDAAGNIVARLGLATFDNLRGLLKMGENLYAATDASGQARPAGDCRVQSGALEGSNVDLAEEMTRLIRAQRAYTMISRCITTADQMESTANNLRR
jgi:flagellar basal-body rod protein FlgG